MPSLSDYQFQSPGSGGPHRRDGGLRKQIVIGALVVFGGAAIYWFNSQPTPPSSTAPAQTAAPAPAPAPAATPLYDLPPVDDSDDFVRDRFSGLSSHPLLATWLKTTGLARNLVVVVDNVSRGLNPSPRLRALRPAGDFRVIREGNALVLDPRNYQRFNPIAEAASSIDPAAAGKLYATLKPLLQLAYDELGNQEPIDRALERAVSTLLGAPVVDGDVRLVVGGEGIGYRFLNTSLESLPGAQKQLIRMGPQNQRTIQSRLRAFALAAGISADKLP
jgi:hypothetical protein